MLVCETLIRVGAGRTVHAGPVHPVAARPPRPVNVPRCWTRLVVRVCLLAERVVVVALADSRRPRCRHRAEHVGQAGVPALPPHVPGTPAQLGQLRTCIQRIGVSILEHALPRCSTIIIMTRPKWVERWPPPESCTARSSHPTVRQRTHARMGPARALRNNRVSARCHKGRRGVRHSCHGRCTGHRNSSSSSSNSSSSGCGAGGRVGWAERRWGRRCGCWAGRVLALARAAQAIVACSSAALALLQPAHGWRPHPRRRAHCAARRLARTLSATRTLRPVGAETFAGVRGSAGGRQGRDCGSSS